MVLEITIIQPSLSRHEAPIGALLKTTISGAIRPIRVLPAKDLVYRDTTSPREEDEREVIGVQHPLSLLDDLLPVAVHSTTPYAIPSGSLLQVFVMGEEVCIKYRVVMEIIGHLLRVAEMPM